MIEKNSNILFIMASSFTTIENCVVISLTQVPMFRFNPTLILILEHVYFERIDQSNFNRCSMVGSIAVLLEKLEGWFRFAQQPALCSYLFKLIHT